MRGELDIKSIFPLIASAVGGCAAVVSFTFLTFVTKGEAQVEQDHIKSKQEDVDSQLHELRVTMVENQREMNQKLDKLLYYYSRGHR